MSELRKDPISGHWVIISTERGSRPSDFGSSPATAPVEFCPFCEGHEDKTPPEIFSFREENSKPNQRGWSLRVVPNKFPALRIEGYLERKGDGIYDRMNGIGAHEVVIETPHHAQILSSLSEQMIGRVFIAYRERIRDLANDRRFRFCIVFKNQGFHAGATLLHAHSQIVALPITPQWVENELGGARRYYNQKERCIFCDILRQELDDDVRIVTKNDHFAAIAPYAPRFPFETWILPLDHCSNYEDISYEQIQALASLIKDLLCRLETALEYPPFNYMIHTSPLPVRGNNYYHWHIELIPRLTSTAGFEWGTGFYINPTPPEDAAVFLRKLRPRE